MYMCTCIIMLCVFTCSLGWRALYMCLLIFNDHGFVSKDGKTALHAACDNGDKLIVQMLLDHNAKVNIQDKVSAISTQR